MTCRTVLMAGLGDSLGTVGLEAVASHIVTDEGVVPDSRMSDRVAKILYHEERQQSPR